MRVRVLAARLAAKSPFQRFLHGRRPLLDRRRRCQHPFIVVVRGHCGMHSREMLHEDAGELRHRRSTLGLLGLLQLVPQERRHRPWSRWPPATSANCGRGLRALGRSRHRNKACWRSSWRVVCDGSDRAVDRTQVAGPQRVVCCINREAGPRQCAHRRAGRHAGAVHLQNERFGQVLATLRLSNVSFLFSYD